MLESIYILFQRKIYIRKLLSMRLGTHVNWGLLSEYVFDEFFKRMFPRPTDRYIF